MHVLFLLLQMFFSHFCYALIFIYKQLGSVLSSQSSLYFQGFLASKLLNGCLVFWPSNQCLQGMKQFQDSKSTFLISDFKIFPKLFLRHLNFGVLLVWRLFYVSCKGKIPFFFKLRILLLLSEKGLSHESCKQFAMGGLVAYKSTKCSKSINGFSTSRLAIVEEFF